MASLNPLTRELVFKIVFYGPGLGGKTTTLQYIHAATRPEHRGKMVSLATPTDRTLYFDFLPLRVPKVLGMGVRLQLFTVPGQVHYAATRKLVLTGADGVVFVADSQRGRMDANQESVEDLVANLAEHNRALHQMPVTFQWNKRDLSDLVPLAELDREFNPGGAPSIATVATSGEGVFEGLERITRLVVRAYKAELPKEGRALETRLDSSDDIGIADAIRGLTEAPGRSPTPFGGTPVARQEPKASSAPTEVVEELPTVNLTGDEGRGFSLVELWSESEQGTAREVEAALAARDASRAVRGSDHLLTRVLASAAGLGGSVDAPRDPGMVVLLLGLDGRRYLAFRSMVRAARQGEAVVVRDALECYAFALEARRARERIGGDGKR